MVLLANQPHVRSVIVTDRDEMDKQIEGVFQDAGETIHRSSSGRDLMRQFDRAELNRLPVRHEDWGC